MDSLVLVSTLSTGLMDSPKSYVLKTVPRYFTHATPTLYNAGTKYNQMSSCFLLSMAGDSIEGIFETLKRTALISKSAGGIGIAISNIRASGSYIRGTNGYSNGLVPMLRVFNDAARYVDQGGIFHFSRWNKFLIWVPQFFDCVGFWLVGEVVGECW